jgi:hypothetical protein
LFFSREPLEVLPQIHAGIEAGDLMVISVEQQGVALEKLAEEMNLRAT